MTCLLLFYRNYFAFVAKESGKFYCHVFLETEVGTFRCSDPLPKFTLDFFSFQVDAGTIVTTIQKLLAPDTAKQHRK